MWTRAATQAICFFTTHTLACDPGLNLLLQDAGFFAATQYAKFGPRWSQIPIAGNPEINEHKAQLNS